jgi:hypothetical protein
VGAAGGVLGPLVAAIPPLSIGSIRLADGRLIKGFLAEAASADITDFRSSNAFVAGGAAERSRGDDPPPGPGHPYDCNPRARLPPGSARTTRLRRNATGSQHSGPNAFTPRDASV